MHYSVKFFNYLENTSNVNIVFVANAVLFTNIAIPFLQDMIHSISDGTIKNFKLR